MTLDRVVSRRVRTDTRLHNAGEGLPGRKLRKKEESSLYVSRLAGGKQDGDGAKENAIQ